MAQLLTLPVPEINPSFFSISTFLSQDFRNILDDLFIKSTSAKRYKPKLYKYSDFILVKLYALIRNISIDEASEFLNNTIKTNLIENGKFREKVFKDKIRKRRVIPHQTTVDKFFRRLSEKDVKNILGAANDALVSLIVKKIAPGRTWTGMVDNTKYPYYGVIDPLKHIQAPKLPGTKYAWFMQGVSIHSSGIHIYTDFHSLTKGVYRAKDVPMSFAWQKWCGIKLSKVEFDREFYRAALVQDLKKINLDSLFPTKNYPWVKYHIAQFLLNPKHNGVVGTIFSQSMNQYPHQKSVFVRLIIVGHDDKSAYKIREAFQLGKITFNEAYDQLAGFYTTLKPWKNIKAWVRYLAREYKRRWNIETGFKELNKIHWNFRTTKYELKLMDLYLRGLIYNSWQAWRLTKKRENVHGREYTFNQYKYLLTGILEEVIIRAISERY